MLSSECCVGPCWVLRDVCACVGVRLVLSSLVLRGVPVCFGSEGCVFLCWF